MDIRERLNDREEAVRSAIDARLAQVWTAEPARVVAVDMKAQTVDLQLTVKRFIRKEDGSQEAVDVSVLKSVPMEFPRAGNMVITMPVKVGDEGMVTFTGRSKDAWQQSGGDQKAVDASMHGLSGGVFRPGLSNDTKKLENVSEDAVQMRSVDGETTLGLDPKTGVSVKTDQAVAINAARGVAITGGAGNVNFTGTLIVTGEIILNGIHLSTHKHTGVEPGGGTSTGPTD